MPPIAACAIAALVAAGACLPGSGPPLNPVVDDAGTPPPVSLGDDASMLMDVDLGGAFAVAGLQPAQGPWSGGTRTNISGRGFSSNVEVWIGPTKLDSSSVFASDPTNVTVITPPGAPGPADVRVHDVPSGNDATLPAGFFYESFGVTPGTGSTTGGTLIALSGNGTHWTSGSTVAVGGKACPVATFKDATDLSCTTPANDAGSYDVVVTNTDGTNDRASDAFVYSDSPDGYRGGLAGGALNGTLTVLAYDSWTGSPVSGVAIAGSNIATAIKGTLDANGIAHLTDPSLTGKVTVTVTGHCHQPWTYVDVPVDNVTVYLNPTLSPACSGNPPSGGNYFPQDQGEVDGELVWPGGIEFQRASWSSVPMPANPNQRQVAYVFTATGYALDTFNLPDEWTATTPQSGGQLGYAYTLTTSPGNQTLYAYAGIQDDSNSRWSSCMPTTYACNDVCGGQGVSCEQTCNGSVVELYTDGACQNLQQVYSVSSSSQVSTACGATNPGGTSAASMRCCCDTPTFEPYVMGVARGAPVQPNAKTVGVDIQMTSLLDRSLSVAPQMPPQGGRGPDRLVTTVSIDLGAGAYAVLPQGSQTRLLPVSGTIDFVGVPALDGMLVGSRYDLTAAAVTGTAQQDPTSAVAYIETTDANDPVSVGGFFAIPTLSQPGITPWSGTHVQMQASGSIDLALFQVGSGSGLVTWTIVSPGNLSFDLPDISQVSGVDTLVHGRISTTFDIASIAGFDYGTLRTGQLSSSAWNAYAEDTANGSY